MLAKKKAVVNMKNKDEQCFQWCFLRHLKPVKLHPERVSDLREKAVADRKMSLLQIDNSNHQVQSQMRCLESDRQLQFSNTIKLAVRFFIAVLRLWQAAPASEHSLCQTVCGTVPAAFLLYDRQLGTPRLQLAVALSQRWSKLVKTVQNW